MSDGFAVPLLFVAAFLLSAIGAKIRVLCSVYAIALGWKDRNRSKGVAIALTSSAPMIPSKRSVHVENLLAASPHVHGGDVSDSWAMLAGKTKSRSSCEGFRLPPGYGLLGSPGPSEKARRPNQQQPSERPTVPHAYPPSRATHRSLPPTQPLLHRTTKALPYLTYLLATRFSASFSVVRYPHVRKRN